MATNAVPPHTHDERYVSKRMYDVRTGATRTVFGQQRRWPIQEGHSLLLPDADIDANAEIVIEDGGELALVGGGGLPDHTDLFGLTDDDHTQYLLASTYGGRSAFGTNWTDLTDTGATTLHKHDHGGQDGLADDDHTQYALLAGRSGGQALIGGTAANDDLTLEGTSNATRTTSYVILQPNSGNVGINTSTPGTALDIASGTLKTVEATVTETYLEPGGLRMKNIYTGGGWARGLLTYEDTAGTDYFALGAFGSGQTFTYAWFGPAYNGAWLYLYPSNRVAIGATNPAGTLEVTQASTTAAIPTLVLDQTDLSEEFIEFDGTVAAGNPIDTAALGTYYGKIRVSVNGTFKYIALYDS